MHDDGQDGVVHKTRISMCVRSYFLNGVAASFGLAVALM